jgi:hypothetical protein
MPTLTYFIFNGIGYYDKSDEQEKGMQWGLHDKLEDLDFADDICILAQSFNDMEAKLNDLNPLRPSGNYMNHLL